MGRLWKDNCHPFEGTGACKVHVAPPGLHPHRSGHRESTVAFRSRNRSGKQLRKREQSPGYKPPTATEGQVLLAGCPRLPGAWCGPTCTCEPGTDSGREGRGCRLHHRFLSPVG